MTGIHIRNIKYGKITQNIVKMETYIYGGPGWEVESRVKLSQTNQYT